MNGPRPGETLLLELLAHEARGPRRHSLFAAWLAFRTCFDLAQPPGVAERNARRRLQALRKRLGTLTLPVAFRRSLHDIIDDLNPGTPDAPIVALDALARVVRETLGEPSAAVIGEAARQLGRPNPDATSEGEGNTSDA